MAFIWSRIRRAAALVAAVAAAVGGLGYAASGGAKPAPAEPTPAASAAAPRPVLELLAEDVAVAELRPLGPQVALSGTLEARVRGPVGAPRAGQLTAVLVRPGDAVKRGQVVARLDVREAALELREREAERASALAELEVAAGKLERAQELAARELIATAELEQQSGDFRVREARLKVLEAQLERARVDADPEIRAPIEGVVATRSAEPGARVGSGEELLQLVDLASLELTALVSPAELGAVRVGQQAHVEVEGFPGREFTGEVERISPSAAEGSRSIAVYLQVPNPGRELRAGSFAHGRLEVPRGEQALLIPVQALREQDGAPFVLLIEGGALERRPVSAGRRDTASGAVEIVSGLEAGAQVLLGSTAEAGTAVRIAGASDKPTSAAN